MNFEPLTVYAPAEIRCPVVLDSPHSGSHFPADFGAAVSEYDLRDGEDCFIDELYRPAVELGMPLLAALFPRTYLDPNRHAADIDLALLENAHWPHPCVPSGKAAIGKALIWRTLDDGRPIYDRVLSVAEVQARIDSCHKPYFARLSELLDAAHARFGVVVHLNCHSMNSVGGPMAEGRTGKPRADFVLGDRDGSTCDPALTALVRERLQAMGYEVAVNDPFKGVELVRAFADPGAGRNSLQLEINKRLYMDQATRRPHEGFAPLQRHLMQLLAELARWPARSDPNALTG
ncbi:MAG: N-formylglutamate amidohydrolase [Rubrivivax sp.]|nr:N-formylglutamate amidohydrolase [Rubrivivax sp.]MDP3082980.1 N-formylglutamate amidohydrolase [Rubrivivax sp.]